MRGIAKTIKDTVNSLFLLVYGSAYSLQMDREDILKRPEVNGKIPLVHLSGMFKVDL